MLTAQDREAQLPVFSRQHVERTVATRPSAASKPNAAYATLSNIGPKASRFLTFAGLICTRSVAHANPRRCICSCAVNYRCRFCCGQDDQTGAGPSPLHSLREIGTMNLSRASYYAEVISYPVVVTGIVLARMTALPNQAAILA